VLHCHNNNCLGNETTSGSLSIHASPYSPIDSGIKGVPSCQQAVEEYTRSTKQTTLCFSLESNNPGRRNTNTGKGKKLWKSIAFSRHC
jgi:hypothetical protein